MFPDKVNPGSKYLFFSAVLLDIDVRVLFVLFVLAVRHYVAAS